MIVTKAIGGSWDFDAHAFEDLASLFETPGYAGYKPTTREAPNGDGMIDTGKRYLHVSLKNNPPAWARDYLALAHFKACEIAERIGVPGAFYPRVEDGTLRVLEYPSAAHRRVPESPFLCDECRGRALGDGVCPALASGAGTAEHTDFDLFTVNLWRSTYSDHEQRDWDSFARDAEGWSTGAPPWHLGEIGELVGLGRAMPHRVPARPYAQRALVYFAMPAHAARLPGHLFMAGKVPVPDGGLTVGEWVKERMARSRVDYK